MLAATSSWVESGLEAQRSRSAPPAFSVRARFAVSAVTCRHADMRMPERGFSAANRSRMARRTGMSRSAHSIRCLPRPASFRSFTSPLGADAVAVALAKSGLLLDVEATAHDQRAIVGIATEKLF